MRADPWRGFVDWQGFGWTGYHTNHMLEFVNLGPDEDDILKFGW